MVGDTISVVVPCPCSFVGLFVGPVGSVVVGITTGVTASVDVPALLPVTVPGSFVGTIIAGLVLPSFPAFNEKKRIDFLLSNNVSMQLRNAFSKSFAKVKLKK